MLFNFLNMKKLFLLLLITTICFTSKAVEVRAMIIEPYPPIVTHDDSLIHMPNYYNAWCNAQCFKFYDTLLRYDCPCFPDDTVTAVGWTFFFGPFPYQFDTIVPKGTVYYKCYNAFELPKWQFSVFGGSFETKTPIFDGVMELCKPYSFFTLKEIENSCNHKKWQVLDSSQNIPIDSNSNLTRWYLIIKDSLQNIEQIDSGTAITPYTDSVGLLITHQRQSPTFEINTPGLYSISYILTIVDQPSRYGLTDTSTTYVRVDCATGIKNNTQNTNIHVQMLPDNFIQITNNNQTYKQQFLRLYSTDGKLLFEQPLNNKQYNLIKFNKFGIGMFILTIIEENQLIFSDKIMLK